MINVQETKHQRFEGHPLTLIVRALEDYSSRCKSHEVRSTRSHELGNSWSEDADDVAALWALFTHAKSVSIEIARKDRMYEK